MTAVGINVALMWVEPNEFFPVGYCLDPVGAEKFKKTPPQFAPAKKLVEMDMKSLYTCDRAHENWWTDICRDYQKNGPYDFKQVYERKPLTIVDTDMTGKSITRQKPIETPMGVREN